MPKQLDKIYDPKSVEGRTYEFWQKGGYFHTQIDPGKKPYTIVMPPPNITGQLHMGHALDEYLAGYPHPLPPDAGLRRFVGAGDRSCLHRHRSQDRCGHGRGGGYQSRYRARRVFEAGVGMEEHLWRPHCAASFVKLGSSCDWERERFTMDEGCSRAVREVFVRLYEKGLIYRGERIVNWCTHCQTSISDAEVEL